MMQTSTLRLRPAFIVTIGIVLLVTLYRLYYLHASGLNLFFDEAQYWFWAKHPDFGYYSKPPMVAWMITLTTSLCGDGEACIRLSSPLLYAGTSLFIYAIAINLYNERVAFWSAITFLTLPAVTLSSTLVSTDPSLLFFFSASLYCFIRAVESNTLKWWIAAGIAAGFGMLSKYTMVLFLPSILLFFYFTPAYRQYLYKKNLWLAVLVTFLIFLPNIFWNADNGFVSFLHTKDNAHLEQDLFHPAELFAFIGAQFGVFGPVLFTVFILILLQFKHHLLNARKVLLLSFILPTLAIILCVSLLSRAHANWAATIYIPATILVVGWLLEHHRDIWLKISLALHLLLLLLFVNLPLLVNLADVTLTHQKTAFTDGKLMVKDPFSRLRGWKALGEATNSVISNYPDAIILADERKTVAELIYYLQATNHFNTAPIVVKWNPNGTIEDHYELVTDLNQYKDRPVVFITRNGDAAKVLEHFTTSRKLQDIFIPLYSTYTMQFTAYYLKGFKGY